MFFLPDNERGAMPLLLLVVIVGLIGFLVVASTFSFKNGQFASLFPKPASHAAGPVYYIDCTSGSDSNTGISQDSAWKTFSHINNYLNNKSPSARNSSFN